MVIDYDMSNGDGNGSDDDISNGDYISNGLW